MQLYILSSTEEIISEAERIITTEPRTYRVCCLLFTLFDTGTSLSVVRQINSGVISDDIGDWNRRRAAGSCLCVDDDGQFVDVDVVSAATPATCALSPVRQACGAVRALTGRD